MRELIVIGVIHDDEHEDYSKLLDYIRTIEADKKVSLEHSGSIEELLQTPPSVSDSSGRRFFRKSSKVLDGKGISLEAVEDIELHKKYGEIMEHFTEESFICYQISLLRSISMYNQALSNGSDILLIGSFHAYDIERLMETAKVRYMTEVSPDSRRKLDITREKYLRDEFEFTREQLLERPWYSMVGRGSFLP